MISLLPLVVAAHAANATNISCQYNPDTGALEATLPWKNTLGAAADKACADADARRLMHNRVAEQPVVVYRSAASFVPPAASKTVMDASMQATVAAAVKAVNAANAAEPKEVVQPEKFAINSTDKSVAQVLVRWAGLAGYEVRINEAAISKNFPKHTVAYVDMPIARAGLFKPQSNFQKAVQELRSRFATAEFSGLDFQAVVDPHAQIVYLRINEKGSKTKAS